MPVICSRLSGSNINRIHRCVWLLCLYCGVNRNRECPVAAIYPFGIRSYSNLILLFIFWTDTVTHTVWILIVCIKHKRLGKDKHSFSRVDIFCVYTAVIFQCERKIFHINSKAILIVALRRLYYNIFLDSRSINYVLYICIGKNVFIVYLLTGLASGG